MKGVDEWYATPPLAFVTTATTAAPTTSSATTVALSITAETTASNTLTPLTSGSATSTVGPVVVASDPQTDGDGPAGSAVFTDVIAVILGCAGYLVRSKRRRAEIKRESLGVREL